jgi:hypothetical protein
MAGESTVRRAMLGADRNGDSNHHERDRGELLHAVILRLFAENAQRSWNRRHPLSTHNPQRPSSMSLISLG